MARAQRVTREPAACSSSSVHARTMTAVMGGSGQHSFHTRRCLTHLLEQPKSWHARLFEDKTWTFADWELHRNAAWRHRIEPVIL